MTFKTSNPILSENRFRKMHHNASNTETMSLEGTLNKTLMLFLVLFISASYTWNVVFSTSVELLSKLFVFIIPSIIITVIIAIVIAFKPTLAKWLSFIYAALEGLLIGLISAILELMYTGIVLQAVMLTFGVALIVWFIFKYKIIEVNNKFRVMIISATLGIAVFYLISFIASLFGSTLFQGILYGNSWISIGLSLFIVAIAALNLVLDFDFITRASKGNFSKDIEWYGAFGLLVTLIWLYIEILRLLSKINSRR